MHRAAHHPVEARVRLGARLKIWLPVIVLNVWNRVGLLRFQIRARVRVRVGNLA